MSEAFPESPRTIDIEQLPDINNIRDRGVALRVSQQPWANYTGLEELSSLRPLHTAEDLGKQKDWNQFYVGGEQVQPQHETEVHKS